ncbi:MAG TPA: hypothetical protein VJR90_09480 [Gammaproteobacteria bacterium]|nr:hypothetical protein [Gammaproteobacteria bacterium]
MNKLFQMSLFIALFFTSTFAAASAPAGLDKIAAYTGTWKGQTEKFNTSYSKAGHETDTIHNDCWRSGDFYVIHQTVNGKPAPVLSVYTYDANADLYHVYGVPMNGDDPGAAGKLIIKGNVWTFPWEYHDKGKTIYFRVVNTWSSPRSIEYRQEFSNDKVHWTLVAKGTEIKTRS